MRAVYRAREIGSRTGCCGCWGRPSSTTPRTAISLVEDCVAHPADGTDRIGRDAVFELIRGFYSSFPDYTHGIEEMIAEGDLVAVRVN
ncbi:MAG: ester cyclase [Acidobacteria bacterium]|nr:ester cyclase [Acidobacteriota bacterium]